MSYDEETAVRERLHRLLSPPVGGVPVGAPVPLIEPTGVVGGFGAGRPGPAGEGVGAAFPGSGDADASTSRSWSGGTDGDTSRSWSAGADGGVSRSWSAGADGGVSRAWSGGAASTEPAGWHDDSGPVRPAAPEAAAADGFGAGVDGRPTGRVLPGPGAFDPGRRGVRALAVVAVLVVLGAGLWAWRSRPQVEPVAPVADAATVAPDAPAEATPTPGGELVVAVAGKVRRPGLVRVPAGARVADAVQAAGGALPGVDVALLNPARKVADGELILVGVPAPAGAAPGGAVPGGGAPGADPGAGGKVNLNTATLAQLDALPGVGPVLAQRILAHRDQHGGFRSVGDLRQVDGIGDARYEQLKDLVTV